MLLSVRGGELRAAPDELDLVDAVLGWVVSEDGNLHSSHRNSPVSIDHGTQRLLLQPLDLPLTSSIGTDQIISESGLSHTTVVIGTVMPDGTGLASKTGEHLGTSKVTSAQVGFELAGQEEGGSLQVLRLTSMMMRMASMMAMMAVTTATATRRRG